MLRLTAEKFGCDTCHNFERPLFQETMKMRLKAAEDANE